VFGFSLWNDGNLLNKWAWWQWFSLLLRGNIADLGLAGGLRSVILLPWYFTVHIFFASTTAHITAMFAAFYMGLVWFCVCATLFLGLITGWPSLCDCR